MLHEMPRVMRLSTSQTQHLTMVVRMKTTRWMAVAWMRSRTVEQTGLRCSVVRRHSTVAFDDSSHEYSTPKVNNCS